MFQTIKWLLAEYALLPKPIQVLLTSLEAAAAGVFIVWLQQPSLSKASLSQLVSGIGTALALAFANWLKHSPLLASVSNGQNFAASRRLVFMLAAGICMCTVTTGCRHGYAKSNNPVVIQAENINQGAHLVKDIADGLTSADYVLDGLQASEPEYYANVRPWLTRLAKANDAAHDAIAQCIAGKNCGNWQGKVAAIAQIGSTIDPRIFGFKNAGTQSLVKAGFNSLLVAITAIAQFSTTPAPTSRSRFHEFPEPLRAGFDPNLISALLALLATWGIPLVKDAVQFLEGNPKLPGESDLDYVARLNADTQATLNAAAGEDQQIEAEAGNTTPGDAKSSG